MSYSHKTKDIGKKISWAFIICQKLILPMPIVWLPSTREYLFGFNASGHCLVRVRMLLYLPVGLRITITQLYMHTMQQTRTHKAVTLCVEAKKVLSRRRQSEYSSNCFCHAASQLCHTIRLMFIIMRHLCLISYIYIKCKGLSIQKVTLKAISKRCVFH